MDVVARTTMRAAYDGYINSGCDLNEVTRLKLGPIAADEPTFGRTSSKLKGVDRVTWGKVPFATHKGVITIVLQVAREDGCGGVWSSLRV